MDKTCSYVLRHLDARVLVGQLSADPDEGSLEPKRNDVDSFYNICFSLDYLLFQIFFILSDSFPFSIFIYIYIYIYIYIICNQIVYRQLYFKRFVRGHCFA